MDKLNEVKDAAKHLEEPVSELAKVFEDLLGEYNKAKNIKDKLAIARELSKIADILLKKEKKEKSKHLEKMQELYGEIM